MNLPPMRTLVLIHMLICFVILLITKKTKITVTMKRGFQIVYFFFSFLAFSYLATDTIGDFLFIIIFGILFSIQVILAKREHRMFSSIIYVILTIICTYLLYISSKHVLVQVGSIIIYFAFITMAVYPDHDISMKSRIFSAIGLAVVVFGGIFYQNNVLGYKDWNYIPTKQSEVALEYLRSEYSDQKYHVYSHDSMRGEEALVNVFFEDDRWLRVYYKNGHIIRIDEI